MRKHTRALFLAAAVALVLGTGTLTALATFGPGLTGPWANPAQSEEDQVIAALKKANYAKAVAARSFDLTGIRATFADDAAVPLTAQQVAELARNMPTASARGLLSYQVAYFEAWRRGAEAFQRVQVARQAGQVPDPKDVAAAIPPRVDPIRDLPMAVHLVRISADHAYVEAETEAQYFRVTLLRRGSQWVVVGENNTGKL